MMVQVAVQQGSFSKWFLISRSIKEATIYRSWLSTSVLESMWRSYVAILRKPTRCSLQCRSP